MRTSYRFDLDTALTAWRRTLTYHRAFDTTDLDELERHLRDHVDALVRSGMDVEAAYARALREMGDYGVVEEEYRKVYWEKIRRDRRWRIELTLSISMLKNYLIVAWRMLRKQKLYAGLNVLGLAVGLACALVLLLYVRHERSFDRHHEHADRIYRVVLDEGARGVAVTPTIVAPLLTREFPEVVAATRLLSDGGVVRYEDEAFEESDFYFADSTFFEVFTHRFVRGDARTALRRPGTVVLTESTARRYFGESDPIGRQLLFDNVKTFQVTAVIEDVPETSHYRFDFLGSFASLDSAEREIWGAANFFTYVRVRDQAGGDALAAKLPGFLARRAASGDTPRPLALQPLLNIHLYSELEYELDASGSIAVVYGLTTVALLVLLIACINFMNLATAQATQRAREVGLRKSLGAQRAQLVGQFLGESALLTGAGLGLGLALVATGLPAFNALSGKTLGLAALAEPEAIALLAVLALVVAMLAGTYPAFYLTRFRPSQVLRGQVRSGRGGTRLRQGLVVLQFAATAALIAGTLAVTGQLRFLGTRDLGFDKAHLVELPINDPDLRGRYPALKEALVQHPAVVAATAVNQIPGRLGWTSTLDAEGLAEDDRFGTKGMPADADVVDGLGLRLVAGRSFPRGVPAPDSTGYRYLVNETLLNRLGWSAQEALGKRMNVMGGRPGEVVGVVQDFHFASLRHAVEPLAIWYKPDRVNRLVVRLAPGQVSEAMAHLETVWARFAAHRPFSYRFVDDVFDQLYRTEQRMGRVLGLFAALAVFVACLGLFGLAAFTAQRRTKEIGVRKVLGASVSGIVLLLSADFLKLVGWAFLLGLPPAYLGMQHWLDGFAYRISLGPAPFLATGVGVLLVALVTVSYQALRTAHANPVESLRHE